MVPVHVNPLYSRPMVAPVTITPSNASPRPFVDPMRQAYEVWQTLLDEQPVHIARFLAAQAAVMAEAITQRSAHVSFALPDKVVMEIKPSGWGEVGYAPDSAREHQLGGIVEQIAHGGMGSAVKRCLAELEQSGDRAVATGAGLLRHATVMYMVHDLLPAGLSVTYVAEDDEEIPSIPADDDAPQSALTAPTDAFVADAVVVDDTIAQDGQERDGRGTLVVPYAPDARRFFMPQWVAFDLRGQLLVKSVDEAEVHVRSMQSFLRVLHAAVALAPYVVADSVYQAKRYGMLGQLVNQARTLARYQVREDIQVIRQRAGANDLNRGLALSLPYFNDQTLELQLHQFEIIPAGRIMFLPAFIVRAAVGEQAKVAQDTRLSPSTRKHLLAEVKELEIAFTAAWQDRYRNLSPLSEI